MLEEPLLATDFAALLRVLAQGDVRFILIGGLAANAHGAVRLTRDVDVVYQRSVDNVRKLVGALEPVSPYLRGAPLGLPFIFDVETVRRGLNFTLTTKVGSLDLLGEVVGGGTYDDLLPHTAELELLGLRCPCVNLETLIRLKRAAGRPKDFESIAELEALLDERGKKP
ncbi:MAG: hypothetical protein K1X64_19490 [Myxococcaceae bacterium]|nr:hypothetical protein [Myxococcaceae bacterium]